MSDHNESAQSPAGSNTYDQAPQSDLDDASMDERIEDFITKTLDACEKLMDDVLAKRRHQRTHAASTSPSTTRKVWRSTSAVPYGQSGSSTHDQSLLHIRSREASIIRPVRQNHPSSREGEEGETRTQPRTTMNNSEQQRKIHIKTSSKTQINTNPASVSTPETMANGTNTSHSSTGGSRRSKESKHRRRHRRSRSSSKSKYRQHSPTISADLGSQTEQQIPTGNIKMLKEICDDSFNISKRFAIKPDFQPNSYNADERVINSENCQSWQNTAASGSDYGNVKTISSPSLNRSLNKDYIRQAESNLRTSMAQTSQKNGDATKRPAATKTPTKTVSASQKPRGRYEDPPNSDDILISKTPKPMLRSATTPSKTRRRSDGFYPYMWMGEYISPLSSSSTIKSSIMQDGVLYCPDCRQPWSEKGGRQKTPTQSQSAPNTHFSNPQGISEGKSKPVTSTPSKDRSPSELDSTRGAFQSPLPFSESSLYTANIHSGTPNDCRGPTQNCIEPSSMHASKNSGLSKTIVSSSVCPFTARSRTEAAGFYITSDIIKTKDGDLEIGAMLIRKDAEDLTENSVKYELEVKEPIAFGGKTIRILQFTHNRDGGEVRVNGELVYRSEPPK